MARPKEQPAAAPGRGVVGRAITIVLVGGCLYLLGTRASAVDPQALWQAMGAVPLGSWGLALCLTLISFRAVAGYDVIAHRALGSPLSAPLAARTGAAAVALGQTLGAGVITGALARWKLGAAPTLLRASHLSALVATLFIGGWAVLTLMVLALWAPLPGLRGGAQLLIALGLLAALLLHRSALWRRTRGRWPQLGARSLLVVLALTAIDTGAAAMALYVLMPPEVTLTVPALLTAYLLALGAGLLSNAPGGVGPFEMVLLWLLPGTDLVPVLAGVLCFRAVYYALPALLALAYAGWRLRQGQRPAHRLMGPTPLDLRLGRAAPRSEALLMTSTHTQVLSSASGGTRLVVGRTRGRLVALFDPLRAGPGCPIATLAGAARHRGLRPCLYKCSARMAARARAAGYAVLPVAQDAVCDPARFDTSGPAARQLRRKLRKATGAGTLVQPLTGALPFEDLARIDAAWRAANGPARGFSMGRFDPAYLAGQRLFGAYRDGQLVGFASFHAGTRCWTLDLMRQEARAPDGTMHLLVATALQAARAEAIPRLSLAAAPPPPDPAYPLPLALQNALDRRARGPGLRQFKASFAPRWEPLYLAAPSRLGLGLSAWEISRAVARPPSDFDPLHDNYEDYEFASPLPP